MAIADTTRTTSAGGVAKLFNSVSAALLTPFISAVFVPGSNISLLLSRQTWQTNAKPNGICVDSVNMFPSPVVCMGSALQKVTKFPGMSRRP